MANDPKDPKKFNPPHVGGVPQNELREHALANERPTPPPRMSPDAPGTGEAATWTPPTGEHPVTKNELKQWGNLNDVKQAVAMVVVAVGTCFGAYKFIMGDARAQSDAGRIALESKVDQNQKSTDASIAELRQEIKQAATKQEVDEVRQDLREFYKAWRDDRRSDRLEQPLPKPDAGR